MSYELYYSESWFVAVGLQRAILPQARKHFLRIALFWLLVCGCRVQALWILLPQARDHSYELWVWIADICWDLGPRPGPRCRHRFNSNLHLWRLSNIKYVMQHTKGIVSNSPSLCKIYYIHTWIIYTYNAILYIIYVHADITESLHYICIASSHICMCTIRHSMEEVRVRAVISPSPYAPPLNPVPHHLHPPYDE